MVVSGSGVVDTSVMGGSVRVVVSGVVDTSVVVGLVRVVVVAGVVDVGLSVVMLLAQGGGVVSDFEQFLGG